VRGEAELCRQEVSFQGLDGMRTSGLDEGFEKSNAALGSKSGNFI